MECLSDTELWVKIWRCQSCQNLQRRRQWRRWMAASAANVGLGTLMRCGLDIGCWTHCECMGLSCLRHLAWHMEWESDWVGYSDHRQVLLDAPCSGESLTRREGLEMLEHPAGYVDGLSPPQLQGGKTAVRWSLRNAPRFPGPSCNGSWFEVPLNPWKWEEFWSIAPALWMCKRMSMCRDTQKRLRKAKIGNRWTWVIENWGVPSWKKPFRVPSNEKPSTCQATPKLTSQSINKQCPMFWCFAGVGLVWPLRTSWYWFFHTLFSLWIFLCLAIKPGSRACSFLLPRFGLPGTEKMRTPQGCLRCWPQMSDTQAVLFGRFVSSETSSLRISWI